ncbi:tRNA (adenosine(37)-N6)-threonylcarbamoyltransferase complex dimerization subunit type 1 TsaB [Pasteurella atlantica]|uniref:tRNA (Adenosine(37)-N6)-threonylcarbamoyltransferase complex dimerization subunit type 1 TsaB n=2 Tax=Pasteurellaceae TaxID=712 RepID=A0ACC6HKH7_9PAST|nr:tRNA (adenosine(37)-N6)-threonylcarbamoyltransferase complex dimerization subunit type 1 TsaB [Pasteurella atlantica]MDP8051387.1 tRNA (adenosine(37)-N6)-threonylcarbamoyltransferase complex dimerization subunit type 1 TsaB [Pasteurella atlantica]MDP8098388.1 tRNA (adenosine(37)-N6)-threonylcarbamoyltransferase complex dimerization subunit type 1 TsaB [Pasteurella atlantica]MDP8104733.1 tRNA (adenosine(37)-N6)-threonylcarbamoyltransferase complex dimerization subunit type 1 TsaB [Pasteurella 
MLKTILVIDTATESCSVALLHKEKITTFNELSPRSHTQRILPMVDELLNNANIQLSKVDALAFGRGPGSFTGVRVGVSVAQGLAFGVNLPVIPISNLTTMAQQAYQQLNVENVICLIDARMNEVYFSQLTKTENGWKEVIQEQVCTPEKAIEQIQQSKIQNCVVVGTGWNAYSQFKESNLEVTETDITLPQAEFMLPLAQIELAKGNTQRALDIEPIYLRNEVTWKKLPNKQ